jgi:glycosyltransferase involved in cell wall biosynthesis
MALDPLVSIITPTFNHEGYIGPCIESVQAQTFQNWELLILNDGSTDTTGQVADRYAEKDHRIRVYHSENVGVFRLDETYNRALSQAGGSLIGILEGDDLWEPDKLRKQVDALNEHPEAVLCWTRAMIVNHGLETIRDDDTDVDGLPTSWLTNDPVGSALNGLYLSNFIPAASILFRTDVLRELGGFQKEEGLPLVDYPTLLVAATRGTFAFVNEVLAKWRWHPNQVTRLFHTDIIERVRDTAIAHHDELGEPFRSRVTVTRRQIERRYQGEVHRAYVQAGRYKLVQRRFAAARLDFKKAFWYPGPIRPVLRLQALAGIGSSLVKSDLEWIARLLGKTDLSWRKPASGTDAKSSHGLSG